MLEGELARKKKRYGEEKSQVYEDLFLSYSSFNGYTCVEVP